MIRKMLVALDGSRTSEAVLPYVRALLRCADVHVTLATVTELGTASEETAAHAYLETVAEPFRLDGARVDIATPTGPVGATLVRLALEEGFDLIALCRRGMTAMKRLLWGSVAADVLRRSPVPVLIVHPGARDPILLRRILVALDGSHRAASVLPVATDLASIVGASMDLLTVADGRPAKLPPEVVSANLIRVQSALNDRHVESEIVIRYGVPAKQILKCADEREVDVIAMSTHGRRGLSRLRYGSVAESILRKGDRPLLVLRTAAIPREHRPSGRSGKIAEHTMTALEQVRLGMSLGGYDRRS